MTGGGPVVNYAPYLGGRSHRSGGAKVGGEVAAP
jgi:hypothetical protein